MRRRWKIAAGVWLAGAVLTGAAGFVKTDLPGLKNMDKVYAAPQQSEGTDSDTSSSSGDNSYQGQLDAAERKNRDWKKNRRFWNKSWITFSNLQMM